MWIELNIWALVDPMFQNSAPTWDISYIQKDLQSNRYVSDDFAGGMQTTAWPYYFSVVSSWTIQSVSTGSGGTRKRVLASSAVGTRASIVYWNSTWGLNAWLYLWNDIITRCQSRVQTDWDTPNADEHTFIHWFVSSGISVTPTNGIFFRNVLSAWSVVLECVTQSTLWTEVTVVPIISAWNPHTLAIKVNWLSSAEFYIDWALVATNTQYIPATALLHSAWIFKIAWPGLYGNARVLDYMAHWQVLSRTI